MTEDIQIIEYTSSPQVRCLSKEPHDMHHHEVLMTGHCSGRTPCGMTAHEPHKSLTAEEKQCEGICTCAPDKNGHQHSPGYHK